MSEQNLLIEIGTEELPPKALQRLSAAFTAGVVEGLRQAGFDIGDAKSFAAPRRLAMWIDAVPATQPDRDVERKGPSVQAAFDADGKPTKAVLGFARSCGVAVDQLQRQQSPKGEWLVFRATEKGKRLAELLPSVVDQALTKLPIPKRMRWGDNNAEFVRPVHWLVLLHGSEIIDSEILGIRSGRATRGHRFHANHAIELQHANDYADALQQHGYVLADFATRRTHIRQQVETAAAALGGSAVIDSDLLDEVTALNEWPVAVAGEFDAGFLSVPPEALIKTMQDNQKYFPVVDADGALMNHFIAVSNIDSKTPEKVKAGNERVIRPRLADARFFQEQDLKKQSLQAFAPALDKVVFQQQLGSIGDKTRRLQQLAADIADGLGASREQAVRAAELSKCDLMTDMVGEFASLQGIMGRHYAKAGGEPEAVAIALEEQYMPRGASDDTPASAIGQVLAIADKMDTLVGIFAIGQKPTGEKDPYALRRAALGVLRTLIERELDLDLRQLIHFAADALADKVDAGAAGDEVFDFMLERLRAYYADRDVSPDVFDAVSALRPSRPLDFDRRICAVQAFRRLPEAEALAAANKRVGNMLKKADAVDGEVDSDLLVEAAETALHRQLLAMQQKVTPLFDAGDYEAALRELAVLREAIDAFFDTVMVNADDEKLKRNRLALLHTMRALFMRAADLSRLQG